MKQDSRLCVASSFILQPSSFRAGPTIFVLLTPQGATAMGRLNGKRALVTGASRGIGRAIAIELAREGAKVAINYSSSDAKAKEVTEEITNLGGTAIFYKANIGSSKEARAMVEHVAKEFGRLDIL